jgi:hypothetical protein
MADSTAYMTPKQRQMVDAVKEYAKDHYEENGWDYVVEAFDDEQILKVVQYCNSPANAIRAMEKTVKLLHSRRQEIEATAY